MPISNDCAAEEILLWIHKGQVVTVLSSVLWIIHFDLCPKIIMMGQCAEERNEPAPPHS
jgi:hypothetical protein